MKPTIQLTYLAVALASLVIPARAADWFVDASAVCAAADGSSALPFCTIGAALAAAAPGDQVLVRAGTYPERLVLIEDVHIVGLEGPARTTIDAQAGGRVVEVVGARVVLEGLTLTGGSAPEGAGLKSTDGVVELHDCRVTNNAAVDSAGALLGGRAGGLKAQGGELLLVRTSIVGNTAQSGVGTMGQSAYGGVWIASAARVTLEDSVIADNSAWSFGAGVIDSAGALTVVGSTIGMNATGSACDPTLVIFHSGVMDVVNSTFASTPAGGEGVSLHLSGAGQASFLHCTFQVTCAEPLRVYRGAGASGAVMISSSIFDGWTGPASSNSGALVSGGYNVIEAAMSPALGFVNGVNGDLVGLGPGALALAPLRDNGGPTPTVALDPGSAALATGDPASGVSADQRGVLRLGGTRDSGAFEATRGAVVAVCVTEPNSTGRPGALVVSGSLSVAANTLALTAHSLPPRQACLFLVARSAQLTLMPGGSAGNLCLASPIGRYLGPGQVGLTDESGVAGLVLDLTQLPQPSGFVAGLAGETWCFQAWHRDGGAGGPTSNFTAATSIALH